MSAGDRSRVAGKQTTLRWKERHFRGAKGDLGRFGRWQVNEERAPFSRRISTRTSPRWATTMCLTIANPRPVPPSSRLRALSTR